MNSFKVLKAILFLVKMVLLSLKNRLDSIGYSTAANQVLQKHCEKFPEYSQYHLSKLDSELLTLIDGMTKDFYDFFYFSKPMNRNELSMLDPALIKGLQDKGLIKQQGKKLQFTMGLYPFEEHYFLAEPFYTYENGKRRLLKRLEQPWGSVYLGFESYILAKHLKKIASGSVLDLCCGSGIIGISCSALASSITGIDISKACVEAARHNAVLNNVAHKSRFLEGDLYEPVKGEKFDTIAANVPYITVPLGVDYPVEGHGGADGLELFRQVINGFPEHLNEGGKGVVILKNTVDFSNYLNNLKEKGYDCKVDALHEYTDIDTFIETKVKDTYSDNKFDEMIRSWKEHYAKLGVDKIRLNLITVQA